MGAIFTSSIEEDSVCVKQLLEAAKFGRWNEVWGILGTPDKPMKQYLLNCIPEERRWGVLHQAVYFNNKDVLKTLLRFKSCDSSIRTKDGICEKGECGWKTPLEIAEQFGHSDMTTLLQNTPCPLSNQEIPTFHTFGSAAGNEKLQLFKITLAAYKETFYPFPIQPLKPMSLVMTDIFSYIDSGENWKKVRDRICQSLFCMCQEATGNLDQATTKLEFYSALIGGYTNEDIRLYDHLNTSLRRQHCANYLPSAEDLAVGPYVLMYNLLLLNWKELKKEPSKTYRKMLISDEDISKYKKGVKFSWLSFVSSTTRYENAVPFPTVAPSGGQSILFIIDNTVNSSWQPRNIEKYATFNENERVYPAGAGFVVTNLQVKDDTTQVWLKLGSDVNYGNS